AAIVFSGARPAAPRWPMTAGGLKLGGGIAPPGLRWFVDGWIPCKSMAKRKAGAACRARLDHSTGERPFFGRSAAPLLAGNGALLAGPLAVALCLHLLGDVGAGLLIDDLHRQLDLAAIVEAEDLHLDLVAEIHHVRDLGDAARRQLRDVHEPVAAAEEVHEGAEIDHLHDLAGVDHADLGLGDDALDPVDRGLALLGVDRGDLDGAVVLDVDLGAGGLGDLADHLAASADHFADLVLRDGELGDARRVLADALARAAEALGHLAQDVQAAVLGLAQRHPHDLLVDRGDLDVHLQRGDAALGAGDLEVHV